VAAAHGETEVVEHEIRIEAPPETVFAYFTDPVKLVSWLGSEATVDPRPGGVCQITITSAAVMVGEYVEVEPYSRVVFRWGWKNRMFSVGPASTLVEVLLMPDDAGTRVRLTHRELPSKPAAEFHDFGWGHFLERLGVAAAGGDPGPSPLVDPPRRPGQEGLQ
jgi:uncharacterized protein YndB with AHSA1/START domain